MGARGARTRSSGARRPAGTARRSRPRTARPGRTAPASRSRPRRYGIASWGAGPVTRLRLGLRGLGGPRLGRDPVVAEARAPALEGGAHEIHEQGMRLVGARPQLGVELDRQVPRMVGQLDDLDQIAPGALPRQHQAARLELGSVLVVELVAMAVAFLDLVFPIGALR